MSHRHLGWFGLPGHYCPGFVQVGSFDTRMSEHLAADTKVTSYGNVINRARQELAWLLQELGGQVGPTPQ